MRATSVTLILVLALAATAQAGTCGNGTLETGEECDDGNLIPYDGCSPTCTIEPHCAGGTCTAVCGDGLKFPQEQCDDGNSVAGDGCSPTCAIEPGWTCRAVDETPPTTLVIPILYRDMLYAGTSVPGQGHPDFQAFGCGVTTGLVNATLGADSEPVFGPNGSACMTSATDFCWWYHQTGCSGAGSTNPFDKLVYLDGTAHPTTLTLAEMSSNVYQFSSTQFYPVDGLGWNAGPNPQTDNDCSGTTGHNFSFTSELHYPFTYSAASAPTFSFTGDDDVWAFINGHLAVDLGGTHGPATGSVTLNSATAATLGLVDGGMYSIDLFQAERHTCGSDYTLTLSGFTHTVSTCHTTCGDGVVAGSEVCDDGAQNGTYGHCNATCTAEGPRCGDGVVNGPETCDDGAQNGTAGHCNATCTGQVPVPTATPTSTPTPTPTATPEDSGWVPPDTNTGKCETLVAGHLRTLSGCMTKCQIKQADTALYNATHSKPKAFDEEACEQGTGKPVSCRTAYNNAATKLLGRTPAICPSCLDTGAQSNLADLVANFIENTNGQIYCAGTTSLGGDDTGLVPPDTNTGKCEDLVAAHLRTLFRCMTKCQIKQANTALYNATHSKPRVFDEEACEQGTAKKPISCRTAYNNATTKLLGRMPNICPPCLDSTAQSNLADLVVDFIEDNNGQIYCAGTTPLSP